MFFKQTARGGELLKILLAIEEFKKKYPEDSLESLEFVGIYDGRLIIEILRHYLKR